MSTKQTNITGNPARNLVFFEGEELAYNYKTGQWTRVPAYDGYGMYSVNNKSYDIGLVVYSSGSVDLQEQQTSDPAQDAAIATAAIDPNEGGRSVVTGIRPLYSGVDATVTVQAGTQDFVYDSANWCSATSLNSRTGMGNMRCEGRYMRVRVNTSGAFDVVIGADVDYSPAGSV